MSSLYSPLCWTPYVVTSDFLPFVFSRPSLMCYTCALLSTPSLCIWSAFSLSSLPVHLCLFKASIPAFFILTFGLCLILLSMFAPLIDFLCTKPDSSKVLYVCYIWGSLTAGSFVFNCLVLPKKPDHYANDELWHAPRIFCVCMFGLRKATR